MAVNVKEGIQNLPSPAIGCIASMVERRDRAKALIDQALDLIAAAKAIAPQFSFESSLGNKVSWYNDNLDSNKEILRKELDRRCWHSLLENTKFGAVLNSEQLDKIRNDIAHLAPELTLNRAMTTFMDLYMSREDTFRAGLVDVFSKLSGHYKSHDSFKVQKRIILNGALSAYGWASFSYHRDRFNDLWHYLSLGHL
jgi:hypothetical protein